MTKAEQLARLLDLAETLGIEVRRTPAAGQGEAHPSGALVRLRDKELLFLDPTVSLADQIDLVAAVLAGRQELEGMYLKPDLRSLLAAGQPQHGPT